MTVRPAFKFDVNRCVGCRACEMACVIANTLPLQSLPASGSWREVRTFNELHVPGVELIHLSMACNHCLDAPCMEQCPARAYSRDDKTGAVLIDADLCLGCRYCSWVCPYDAPRFDESRGIMTKCTFCVDRQHEGTGPACTLSCPTGALEFDQLEVDQLTQQVVGFAAADTRPAVQVVGLAEERRLPETHLPDAPPPWRVMWTRITPRITFRHEWTLAVFTLLLAVLTGLMAGWIAGCISLDWRWFLAAGALGAGLSASHLGRRERAWRAALHLDESWLSREIILSGAFIGAATLGLMQFSITTGPLAGPLGLLPDWWPRMGLYSGLLCLLAVDMVYRVAVIRRSGLLHSAQALATGLMLMGTAAGDWWVFAPLGLLKLVLFWTRQNSRRLAGLDAPLGIGVARTVLLVAGLLWLGISPTFSWPAFFLLVAAEFLDRALFYSELEIPTPASLMMDQLANRPGTN